MNKPAFSQNYITAIDIGSSKVACLVAEVVDGKLEIRGYKIYRSLGIKNGQIADIEKVSRDVARVLDETEAMVGGKKSDIVIVNAAVNHLSSVNIASAINVAGRPITENEINRLIDGCAGHFNVEDHKILHCIPTGFNLDNLEQVKEPKGMYGTKLGVQIHIISANKWHLKNLDTVMNNIHINYSQAVATPYASALACLNDYEKDLGTVLIDIGAGTSSVCVFYNGQMIYSDIIPIGGADITKSIAQRLTISMAQAEKLKIYEGSAFLVSADKHDLINVPSGDGEGEEYASIKKSELTNVIAYRVEEIFEIIKNKLKEQGVYELPSNRVVLTGGTSQLQGIKELASAVLDKTVIIKNPINIEKMPSKVATPSFSVCCGLMQFAIENPAIFTKKREFKLKKSKIIQWFLQNF